MQPMIHWQPVAENMFYEDTAEYDRAKAQTRCRPIWHQSDFDCVIANNDETLGASKL